jgi:hypothetical protein
MVLLTFGGDSGKYGSFKNERRVSGKLLRGPVSFSLRPFRRFLVLSTVMSVKFLMGVALCVSLNLLWAPYAAVARGSGGSHSSGSHSSGQHSSKSYTHSKASPGVQRDNHGRIKRSAAAKDHFKRQQPCPSTGKSKGACPGYVIDHVVPLKRGGKDAPGNMQWQTKDAAKLKDRTE